MSLADGEFEYAAPLTSGDGPTRTAAIPHPHPHDQVIFGAQPAAPSPQLTSASPSLAALIDRCTRDPKLRTALFATPLNTPAVATSPPSSARGTTRDKAASSKAAAASKPAKKGKAEVVVQSPEEILIAACSQDLLLYLRDSVTARDDFAAWKAETEVTTLPVASSPLASVDTRLYSHLLDQVPTGGVGVPTILYALFEQCAVNTAPIVPTGKTPAAVDLNEFFAGETLDEVDAFMSSALERVTFKAHAASPSSSWTEATKKITVCTSTLGGLHQRDDTGLCSACGQSDADNGASSAIVSRPPFLKHDDALAIRHTECSLALGLPLIPDGISLAAEKLLADFLPLPGIGGRGMPTLSTESEERQGMDVTQLFQRAISSGEFEPAVFERALLLLDLEEMLLQPAPEWRHTLHAALDETQQTDVDVLIHPLPGKTPASGIPASLPAQRTNKVKEHRVGSSLYHTAHARLGNATVESAVAARLRELHTAAKEADPTGGFGIGFGLRDESDSADDQRAWHLEDRVYQEELDARVLPQRLIEALRSPSGSAHAQVRYRAMFDDLLVAVHVPTPLVRQRRSLWSSYFTPDLSLERWLESSPSIQRLHPTRLFQFADPAFTGKLAHQSRTLFPADQARLTATIVQCGDRVLAYVGLEKDDSFLTLEKVPLEVLPQRIVEVKEETPITPQTNDVDENEGSSSRPGSRGDGRTDRKSSSGTARKGSAKKSATSAGAAAAQPNSGKKPSSAKPGQSSSAKKKVQQEEQAELDILTAEFASAQVELDAARAAEAAAESAQVAAASEAILFGARFGDDTRLAASGRRADGSNRVTYTTRCGLVVEVRGTADEVYMKYPTSALVGGATQPIVPARKQNGGIGNDEYEPAAAETAVVPSSASASLLPSAESFRVVSPDGIIYRVCADGSASLLLPNGHVAQRSSPASSWTWTDNAGVRTQRNNGGEVREVGSVEVAQQHDAESGATVITRQDLTMFIAYADGSSLAQHADGSRIYTDIVDGASTATAATGAHSRRARKRVTVESPLFPPISFEHSLRTDLRAAAESFAAGNGTTKGVERRNVVDLAIEFEAEGAALRKSSAHDAVVLTRRSGERIVVEAAGRVIYVPRGFDIASLPEDFLEGGAPLDAAALPPHVYAFDLDLASGGRVRVRDVEDSLFDVNCLGGSEMVLGRERNLVGAEADSIPASYYPLPENPTQPRVFRVRKDGTGCELLHEQQVQAFLAEVEADPNTRALEPESFDSADGEALSLKYLTTLPRPQAYKRHPVIPNVVRAASSSLAAGSSLAALAATDPLVVLRGSELAASPIAPAPVLVYRHLIAAPHVTVAQKLRAYQEKRAWADWKESQEENELLYQVDLARQDRSPEELAEEARVEAEVRAAREDVERRKAAHARAVAAQEAAADPTLAATRSRPATANAHRHLSSSALLPKPTHSSSEGQAVVDAMVATLTAPPKTFFASKGAPVTKTKSGASSSSRPTSAIASRTAAAATGVTPDSFAHFFAHPSFRRDFLLSTLMQRVTDASSPFIQGSRAREGEEQTASEKEELWLALDEEARANYQAQFESQLKHLVDDCLSFLREASAFLNRPYDANARIVVLQSEPYRTLLERASPSFASLVDQLASVVGFERENERLVLTAKDDAAFREDVRVVREKLAELVQSAAANSTMTTPSPTTKAAAASAAEEKEPPPNALAYEPQSGSELDGGDHIDYDAAIAALSAKERAALTSTPAYQQYLAREARLKSIKSTYSTQQHASHGASFQYTSPFAPKEPFYPPQPPRTSLPAQPNPTAYDVTGALRRPENQIQLPAAMGSVAHSELNQRHLMNELQSGQPRPAPKTSSTVKQTWHNSTAPFAAFVLQPSSLDLGVVRKGCTYRGTLALTNTGNMTGRFAVVQPADREDLVHIKVLYRPGLVAPGLQRRLEVELYAGTAGDLQEEIVIKTEQHIFRLPLTARVLPDAEYARVKAGGVGASNPLLEKSFSVPSTASPSQHATYDRNFPASPLAKTKSAGPFQLTSTFKHTVGAGPPFAKNATLAATAAPRSSFGQTGEIRLVAPAPTAHVQHALQQQQARAAQRTQAATEDRSEI